MLNRKFSVTGATGILVVLLMMFAGPDFINGFTSVVSRMQPEKAAY